MSEGVLSSRSTGRALTPIDVATSRALYDAFARLENDPELRVGIADRRRRAGSSARAGTSRRQRRARPSTPTTGRAASPGSPSCTAAPSRSSPPSTGPGARRRLRAGARRRPRRRRGARGFRPARDRARHHPGRWRRAAPAAAAAAAARRGTAPDRTPDDRAGSARPRNHQSGRARRSAAVRGAGTRGQIVRSAPLAVAAVLEVLDATEAGSVADGYARLRSAGCPGTRPCSAQDAAKARRLRRAPPARWQGR